MLMTARFFTVFVLISAPVFGQARVFTNADLGKPLQWAAPPITDAQLQTLAAHQFQPVPAYPVPLGPQIIIVGGSTAEGPFGPLHLSPMVPLSSPWSFTTHFRRGRLGPWNGSLIVPAGYGPFGTAAPDSFQPSLNRPVGQRRVEAKKASRARRR